MNTDLSIIIPIYNVEPYLCRCLDSILAQTFTDFELVLINDGSPDKCGEIMEDYAKRDERIITIHQENKGVSAARNAGLRIAQGTYVGFVDPDDWVDPEMYEKIISHMKTFNTDIGSCAWVYVSTNGTVKKSEIQLPEVLGGEDFFTEIFAIPRTIQGSVWNKVFLKRNIHSYFDENITIGEDWFFLCEYCKNIVRASFVSDAIYYIYENENSATRKDNNILTRGLDVSRRLVKMAEDISIKAKQSAEANYLDSCVRLMQSTKEPTTKADIRKAFRGYIHSNLLDFAMNSSIKMKTKLIYLYISVAK